MMPLEIFSFSYFESLIHFCVDGVELLEWTGYPPAVLNELPAGERARMEAVEATIIARQPPPWRSIPLLGIAIHLPRTIQDARLKGYSTYVDHLDYTMITCRIEGVEIELVSNVNGRAALANLDNVSAAVQRFAASARLALASQCPELTEHVALQVWFRGESHRSR